jgi:hypothetical protein
MYCTGAKNILQYTVFLTRSGAKNMRDDRLIETIKYAIDRPKTKKQKLLLTRALVNCLKSPEIYLDEYMTTVITHLFGDTQKQELLNQFLPQI